MIHRKRANWFCLGQLALFIVLYHTKIGKRIFDPRSWHSEWQSLSSASGTENSFLPNGAAYRDICHSHVVLCGSFSAESRAPSLPKPHRTGYHLCHSPDPPAELPRKYPLSGGQLLYNPIGYLKFGGFPSPARYFCFTPPGFSNEQLLFLISLDFLLYVQKSRTEVRDFCLHLFCQCKLAEMERFELSIPF